MMTKCKMKQLALAVGVALGGVGLIPSAQAVSLAPDGLGQVLIFPYYTVRGGWLTTISVTNTSATDIVAAKVRFHEAYNSRDVMDFNVILSPSDVWNAWVADSANGPILYTIDRTCTTPQIPVGAGQPFQGLNSFGTASYTGTAWDGGPTTVDRMREGHVEVIMMGTANVARVTALPAANPARGLLLGAIHNQANGTPPGCAALATAFQAPPVGNVATFVSATGLKTQFGYPDAGGVVPVLPNSTANPLKGAFTLVNAGLGWSAGSTPLTLANFWTSPTVGFGVANNLVSMMASTGVTAGAPPLGYTLSFNEPTLTAANTASALLNPFTGLLSAPTAPNGADAVSVLINHTNVINDWSRRTDPAGWTTDTDWVVTFPTKHFYVDNHPANQYSGRATGRPNLPPAVAGGPAPNAVFAEWFVRDLGGANPILNGQSCDALVYDIYNREEQPPTGGIWSPGGDPQLCYETNVLTFDGSNILRSNAATLSSINGLPGEAGWLNLAFLNPTGIPATAGGALVPPARPAIGFQITVRNAPANTQLNEAMIFEHSYSRTYP